MYGYNAGQPMAIPTYTVLPYCVIQGLMNLLHGNKFSPWEDFFVNPFGSVLTNYVSVHVCTGAG